MDWISTVQCALNLAGTVVAGASRGEYGRMPIKVDLSSELFHGEENEMQTVWMSHGDEVKDMPVGLKATAKSESVRFCTVHPSTPCFLV